MNNMIYWYVLEIIYILYFLVTNGHGKLGSNISANR